MGPVSKEMHPALFTWLGRERPDGAPPGGNIPKLPTKPSEACRDLGVTAGFVGSLVSLPSPATLPHAADSNSVHTWGTSDLGEIHSVGHDPRGWGRGRGCWAGLVVNPCIPGPHRGESSGKRHLSSANLKGAGRSGCLVGEQGRNCGHQNYLKKPDCCPHSLLSCQVMSFGRLALGTTSAWSHIGQMLGSWGFLLARVQNCVFVCDPTT